MDELESDVKNNEFKCIMRGRYQCTRPEWTDAEIDELRCYEEEGFWECVYYRKDERSLDERAVCGDWGRCGMGKREAWYPHHSRILIKICQVFKDGRKRCDYSGKPKS